MYCNGQSKDEYHDGLFLYSLRTYVDKPSIGISLQLKHFTQLFSVNMSKFVQVLFNLLAMRAVIYNRKLY